MVDWLEVTLIDELLAEQQRLTAVERFARKHGARTLPAQARYYRDLIPSPSRGRGSNTPSRVDLDACTGCKACVSACHSLNGLDEDEIWRDVGLIHGGTTAEPYQQTVTTACHHCVEPACLEGCPVRAYEKDADTGIVRHLDDQCIGCQYCVLKCPYDVPKYSSSAASCGSATCARTPRRRRSAGLRAGVPERGDLDSACRRRRSANPHARVAWCRRVSVGLYQTDDDPLREKRIPENARAADVHALRLEHAHWPLIGMTVLTQMATGIFPPSR